MKDLTIVIPAYNEYQALTTFLPELIAYCRDNGCQLIIVNDGSKDQTLELLDRYRPEPFFLAINHKLNRGYGGALKSGIQAAQTELVITIDADGQHRLEDVTRLYQALAGNRCRHGRR